tara:strand:- start:231 stop:497 length:267 start_codon:yes stop_codon:yes gene_type:complete
MTTKTRFTHGVWDWEHDESTSSMIQIDSDIGCSICRLQSEGDAHLIATAPEMYRALEMVCKSVSETETVHAFDCIRIEKLLAKARGEL